jgi:hypothetical protein
VPSAQEGKAGGQIRLKSIETKVFTGTVAWQ